MLTLMFYQLTINVEQIFISKFSKFLIFCCKDSTMKHYVAYKIIIIHQSQIEILDLGLDLVVYLLLGLRLIPSPASL